ncbi:GntR family transcriptional regulator [Heyndrickxia ginsengihumi]|uniref:GntR family transcriptional regulator n=1 Tax=Heyndrickxia ginsengihumi TaxID=363870 RepID=UPI001DB8840F|nr:GntR family transcriptional regulator [Heyndrickxia ginsengihumi]MBE6184876.1 GntR family transcriptional regulator [Bacillus sp. (in: firmicutes)]MCM3022588.1 GntR family transcriptional regulator [Heyndrickxia ginsengihumi]
MKKEPKYIMIKNQIMSWILEGRIVPGEKINSENELVKIFSASRYTVRQAIGELVHEGWLYREQGSGTYCAHRKNNESAPKNKKTIGVITTYLSDYIFPSIIRGIESYLTEKGYALVLASTNNDTNLEEKCLQNMIDRKVDGLIVEPTKSSNSNPNIHYYLNLEKIGIPYLMINQFYSEITPPRMLLDDELGEFLATEHLIKLHHKKIMGIFKNDDYQGINRMKGFLKAFRTYELPFLPEFLLTYTTETADAMMKDKVTQILRSPNRPTAIVCYNDEIAMKILDITRQLNLHVPNDLSIVGFDDSHLAETSDVKLTSIKHPKMQMGIDAAKWIVARVEHKKGRETEDIKVYKPELIVRTSTKSLNKED